LARNNMERKGQNSHRNTDMVQHNIRQVRLGFLRISQSKIYVSL
jgi:hypothetical protein